MTTTIGADGHIQFNAPGDDLRIAPTVKNVPLGITVTDAWLTIKADPTDLQTDALVELHITTVQSGDGLVGSTVADAETGLQKVDVEFDLTDAETLVLGTRLRFYDIQVKGDDAKLYTGPPGTIRALANQITIGEPTP